MYKGHRIGWKMLKGVEPSEYIDHKDGNPGNNRPTNMREATHRQNSINTFRQDRALPRGVIADGNRFLARVWVMTGHKNLGSFGTPEEASAAYIKATTELHGEFAYHRRAQ
jgi:hypothetical protein